MRRINGTLELTPLDLEILGKTDMLQRFFRGQCALPKNEALPPVFCTECIPLLVHPYAAPAGMWCRCLRLRQIVVRGRADEEYEMVRIPKAGGKIRTVYRVRWELAEYQRWILRNILSQLPVHPGATAYVPGGSVKRNAAPHTGHRQLVKLDLRDFFGHVTFRQVKDVFAAAGYSDGVSAALAVLCTRAGTLPQGACTSPALANLVFYKLDDRIDKWCRSRGITYTRYSDDLSFSADEMDAAALVRKVRRLLAEEGFAVNGPKTRILGAGECHRITGVVCNEKLQAPAAYRKKLRQEVYYLLRFGLEEHLSRMGDERFCRGRTADGEHYLRSLLGRIDYVLFLNPEDEEFRRCRSDVMAYAEKEGLLNEYKRRASRPTARVFYDLQYPLS